MYSVHTCVRIYVKMRRYASMTKGQHGRHWRKRMRKRDGNRFGGIKVYIIAAINLYNGCVYAIAVVRGHIFKSINVKDNRPQKRKFDKLILFSYKFFILTFVHFYIMFDILTKELKFNSKIHFSVFVYLCVRVCECECVYYTKNGQLVHLQIY